LGNIDLSGENIKPTTNLGTIDNSIKLLNDVDLGTIDNPSMNIIHQ
jgi:hypothetical protein